MITAGPTLLNYSLHYQGLPTQLWWQSWIEEGENQLLRIKRPQDGFDSGLTINHGEELKDDDGAEDEDGGFTFQDSLLIIDEDTALVEVLWMLADVFRIHRDGVLSVLCGRTIGVWEVGGVWLGVDGGCGFGGWGKEKEETLQKRRRNPDSCDCVHFRSFTSIY